MKQIKQGHRSNKPMANIKWGRGGGKPMIKSGKGGKSKKC